MSSVKFTITRDQRRGSGFFLSLGPFATRAEAEAARADLEAAGVDLEQRRRERYASPDLLAIVRDQYHRSGSLKATARALNEAGLPTARRRGKWHVSTVRRMLGLEPQPRQTGRNKPQRASGRMKPPAARAAKSRKP